MVSKNYDIMGRALHFVGPKFSAYIIEFIGTFFLVFTIGLNVVPMNVTDNTNVTAPFAIGSILMVMIFMGGHVSGAHFNPAVTFGVRLTGRQHISTSGALVYLCVQLLGGLVAAFATYGITDETWAPAPNPRLNDFKAFCVEMIYTFALVSVMLNCATTKSQGMNSFFGLAIGFTVLAGAYSAGNLSGAVFNPAVATGPIIVDAAFGRGNNGKYIWIYWLGPLIGGAIASMVFRITNTAEYRNTTAIAAHATKTPPGYEQIEEDEGF